jgi:succinate dehydrogenase/fumarate reductase flavoprotein subunit
MKAETIETDVLIVGGGAAGCAAAMRACEGGARVLVVVKGKMGHSGATPLASCLGAPSPIPGPYPLLKAMKKLYASVSDVVRLPVPAIYANAMRAMLQIHCWLVDQDYFLDFALWVDKEFFPALEWAGTYVLRDEAGRPEVPPGNNPYFVLQSHGMTGYLFGEYKRKEVLARDIPVMEEATVFSLLRGAEGEVAGALVLDYRRGRLYEVVAKTTILATGHTNWLSTRATGTREMAANGLAMALRAGAELQNLEVQWYHASDMAYPESWMRLHNYPNPLTGTPHQAVMVNDAGEPYMTIGDHDVIMPYTIQVKELYKQVRAGKAGWGGGNFTDFRLVDPEVLKTYQYHWEFYEKIGKDMVKDPLESALTWHMSAGGVRADLSTMRTQVPRLCIAGAIGGHMLGGLPLATFDGEVAGAAAAREALQRGPPKPAAGQAEAGETRLAGLLSGCSRVRNERDIAPIQIKKRVREVVWDHMMYEKTGTGLEAALAAFAGIEAEMVPNMRLRTTAARYNTDLVDAIDVQDMLDVCRAAAHASLAREESRGPHFRADFPFTDNDHWLKRIVVRREGGEVRTRFEPVRQKYLRPRRGRIDYLGDPLA